MCSVNLVWPPADAVESAQDTAGQTYMYVTSSAAREVVTFGVWMSRILSAMSWSDLQLLQKLSCEAATDDEGTVVQLSKYHLR